MHGDTLCTDDLDYQAFRTLTRNPRWQEEFLAMTAAQRMQRAAEYRQQSQSMTAMKTDEIMDINVDAVSRAMTEHGVSLLIHGHTHRPQVHRLPQGERIVLGDWGGHFDYLNWPQNEAWHLIREPI